MVWTMTIFFYNNILLLDHCKKLTATVTFFFPHADASFTALEEDGKGEINVWQKKKSEQKLQPSISR